MRQLGSSNIKHCLSVSTRISRGGLFLLIVLLLFSACKNRRPAGVLSEGKMANLLYDYHVALALGQSNSDSADINTRLYMMPSCGSMILRKQTSIGRWSIIHGIAMHCWLFIAL